MVESPDHAHFEELATLLAGGYLSAEELREFRQHALTCAECRQSEADFVLIARWGLPLAEGRVRRLYDRLKFKPPKGVRSRFLQRAKDKGIALSEDI